MEGEKSSQVWRFPKKYAELFKNLPNEDVGEIIKEIFFGDGKNLIGLKKAYFDIIKVDLDNLEKSALNGKKGGRPKKETTGYEKEKPQVMKKNNLKERERERERENINESIDIISHEIIPPKNKITFQEKIKLEFDNDFFQNINEKFKLSKEDFKEELEKFIIHWSEKNPNGKKEKWEMQKTFDPKKRLYTRLGNFKKWDKKNDFNSKVAVIHCPDDWYFNG